MRPIPHHARRWLPALLLAWSLAGGTPAVAQPDPADDVRHDATPDQPLVVQPPKLDAPGADNSCAAQWRRYNAAYACLDPYRITDGHVRPEGFNLDSAVVCV